MPGFDVKAFMRAEITRRTATVEIDTLSAFFPKNKKPVFTVQNLTAAEIAKVREAVTRNAAARQALAKADKDGAAEEVTAAIQTLLQSTGGNLADEYVRYLTIITLGCKDPEIDLEAAKRLAKAAPVGFEALALKILTITGLGGSIKKK